MIKLPKDSTKEAEDSDNAEDEADIIKREQDDDFFELEETPKMEKLNLV